MLGSDQTFANKEKKRKKPGNEHFVATSVSLKVNNNSNIKTCIDLVHHPKKSLDPQLPTRCNAE